jgi:hypothetical protein
MEQTIHNKKYPKSIYGYKCVGPCYKKNTSIIHPIYFNTITTDKMDYFCPTNEWFYKNKSNNIERFQIDKCKAEDANKFDKNINYENLLIPYTNFDELSFLDTYYNIDTFNNALDWITENNTTPINTRQRIFDLAYEAFKNTFDIIDFNDSRIVDFFINLIKIKYLDDFSMNFFKYIMINKDEIKIINNTNYKSDMETQESLIIKQNFILKYILTIENLTNFINNYFRKKQEEKTIDYPSEIIINKFVIYLIGNIKKTFN